MAFCKIAKKLSNILANFERKLVAKISTKIAQSGRTVWKQFYRSIPSSQTVCVFSPPPFCLLLQSPVFVFRFASLPSFLRLFVCSYLNCICIFTKEKSDVLKQKHSPVTIRGCIAVQLTSSLFCLDSSHIDHSRHIKRECLTVFTFAKLGCFVKQTKNIFIYLLLKF